MELEHKTDLNAQALDGILSAVARVDLARMNNATFTGVVVSFLSDNQDGEQVRHTHTNLHLD